MASRNHQIPSLSIHVTCCVQLRRSAHHNSRGSSTTMDRCSEPPLISATPISIRFSVALYLGCFTMWCLSPVNPLTSAFGDSFGCPWLDGLDPSHIISPVDNFNGPWQMSYFGFKDGLWNPKDQQQPITTKTKASTTNVAGSIFSVSNVGGSEYA